MRGLCVYRCVSAVTAAGVRNARHFDQSVPVIALISSSIQLDFAAFPSVKQQLPLKLYESGGPLVIRGVDAICVEPDCASAIEDVRERN